MKSLRWYKATKVPEVTPWFWASKILLTATGEAISDSLNQQLGPAVAFPIMLILVGLALRWQFKQHHYRTAPYWSLVAAIAIIGTSFADGLHLGTGLPYTVTTVIFAVILAAVLIGWRRSEGTLDIHSITNRRREKFYWGTVLATFTLGTAAGDMTAMSLKLSYFPSFLLFGAVILIPWALRRGAHMNAVFCFWFAYTITRPFGASWADYSDQPIHQGGLNLGQIPTAIYLGCISLALIGYMAHYRVGFAPEVLALGSEAPAAADTAVA